MNSTTEFRGGNLPPQAVDWQRVLIAVLWRLLPADQKSITLTQGDQQRMRAAFAPEDPTLVVSSDFDGSNMILTLTTMSAAIAQAKAMGIDVATPPGTAPMQ